MNTTLYFERKIVERNIKREWVFEAIENEVYRRRQADGRICLWGWVDARSMFFRVILLEDEDTLLNAFPDSAFTRRRGR